MWQLGGHFYVASTGRDGSVMARGGRGHAGGSAGSRARGSPMGQILTGRVERSAYGAQLCSSSRTVQSTSATTPSAIVIS
jgi:hypothetical protein